MVRCNICLLFFLFFVSGCAIKDIKEQKSKFIVMKTPEIKFADMGFVSTFDDKLNIQIYSNGEAVLSLNIYKDKICSGIFQCIDKKSFNKKIFHQNYPDDTLENIFLGKPIFGNLNLKKTSNGFTQKILQEGKYDISYSVINSNIAFNDKMHNILIKVENR